MKLCDFITVRCQTGTNTLEVTGANRSFKWTNTWIYWDISSLVVPQDFFTRSSCHKGGWYSCSFSFFLFFNFEVGGLFIFCNFPKLWAPMAVQMNIRFLCNHMLKKHQLAHEFTGTPVLLPREPIMSTWKQVRWILPVKFGLIICFSCYEIWIVTQFLEWISIWN